MSDTPQVTHYADDATLRRIAELERELAAAKEMNQKLIDAKNLIEEDWLAATAQISALESDVKTARLEALREAYAKCVDLGDEVAEAAEAIDAMIAKEEAKP